MTAFCSRVMHAQFAGTPAHDNFHDTSILKPATGSKVSVIVFEDLGCPLCARAHPIEIEATQKYHVPLLRHDFPFGTTYLDLRWRRLRSLLGGQGEHQTCG